MPIPQHLSSTNYAQVLATALDAFHRALTRRWRELVCDAVLDAGSFPVVIRRSGEPPVYSRGPWWDYHAPAARHHLTSGGCAFVSWVHAGQSAPLASITCEGLTHASHLPEHGPDGETVPYQINCGMGYLFARVEDWAWGERNHIFNQLPLFDHHDLTALEQAHDELLGVAGLLGLNLGPLGNGDGSGNGAGAPMTRTKPTRSSPAARPPMEPTMTTSTSRARKRYVDEPPDTCRRQDPDPQNPHQEPYLARGSWRTRERRAAVRVRCR